MDICYVISHGFAARMVLHSELVPSLVKSGFSVGIIVPEGVQESLREIAKEQGVAAVVGVAQKSGFVAANLDSLRRNAVEDVRTNPALWAKHLRDIEGPGRAWKKARAQGLFIINQAVQKVPRLKRGIELVQSPLYRSSRALQALELLRPRCVVSTYPVSSLESSILEGARRLGIPTVGHLLSWDNLSCKGRFPLIPETFLSWGRVMTEEICHYYSTDSSRIFEIGVPHFDVHKKAGGDGELRGRVLREAGLDPSAPYILFGMSSPYFAPREIDVVEELARRTVRGDFGPAMQFLVRPHPQNVTGSLADESWLPRLRALRSNRVGVNFPLLREGLDWYTDGSDILNLGAILGGAAVSLNSGSTLSIDSLVHGVPVVITAHDGDMELPWWKSARRCIEYPHLAKLVQLRGVCVTRSLDETARAILAYLKDPNRELSDRRKACEAECGPVDGRAGERASRAFQQILSSLARQGA